MTSQTPDTQVFLERVERLERQNRRLKRTGVTGLIAVAALLLMAQATPKSRTLETQELVLRDSSGKVGASFGAYRDGPRLTMYGENGGKLTELRADKAHLGLAIYSLDGKSAALVGGQATPILALVDQHEKTRAVLSIEQAGPQLVLTDDDGKPRFAMGVRDGSPLLQAADANGKVTWSAPDNIASQIAARPDKRPRIFIKVWGDSPFGGPILQQATTAQIAAFAQACPDAIPTIDQHKADYTLHLPLYIGTKDGYALYGSDGSLVASSPTASSLQDAANVACRVLLADSGAKNFLEERPDVSTVVIKSTPDGADITVNGKFAGVTPSTLKLPPGDYAVTVQKSGLKAWNRTLTLSRGASISVDATLEKGP